MKPRIKKEKKKKAHPIPSRRHSTLYSENPRAPSVTISNPTQANPTNQAARSLPYVQNATNSSISRSAAGTASMLSGAKTPMATVSSW